MPSAAGAGGGHGLRLIVSDFRFKFRACRGFFREMLEHMYQATRKPLPNQKETTQKKFKASA